MCNCRGCQDVETVLAFVLEVITKGNHMRFCHFHEQKEATKEATEIDIANSTENEIAYRTIYLCDHCGRFVQMYIGNTARVRPIAETET